MSEGTVKWFGASWGAPACEPEDHTATPVGRPCLRCRVAIAMGDRGVTMPHGRTDGAGRMIWVQEPWHLACYLESIRPCPGCPICKPENTGGDPTRKGPKEP